MKKIALEGDDEVKIVAGDTGAMTASSLTFMSQHWSRSGGFLGDPEPSDSFPPPIQTAGISRRTGASRAA